MAKGTTFFNNFPEIAEAFGQIAADLVTDTALDLQGQIEDACPVDTGFLQNTVYTRTYTSNNYRGGGRVSKKAKKSGQYTLPSVPQPPNQYTAYVAVGANYAAYVELGTVKMSPRPFFYQVVDSNQALFEEKAADLEDQIKQYIGQA